MAVVDLRIALNVERKQWKWLGQEKFNVQCEEEMEMIIELIVVVGVGIYLALDLWQGCVLIQWMKEIDNKLKDLKP